MRQHIYIGRMPRILPCILMMVLLVAGCGSQPRWQRDQNATMFAPTAMRLHPVFTQVRDWTGDGNPDGIDTLLEFQDLFGDPTKASGNVVFELYRYRPGFPDPRGERVVPPFAASIDDPAEQRDRWSRTSRGYSFQLAYPEVNSNGTYVLTAVFEVTGGGRFEDRIILEPRKLRNAPMPPASGPAQPPGVRQPQP